MTETELSEAARRLLESERGRIDALLDEVGIEHNRDLVRAMVASALELGADQTDRLDLKITSAAIQEMRRAFLMFRPLQGTPKVTIFGSARTKAEDPLYVAAHDAAERLAEVGWMVITGAGPGIMQAAAEGAGRDKAIGVSIRLPFEDKPSHVFADDTNIVSMKYFFTRKLMLMKESSGFICVPGGFGTLDELFELLTLQQTGKAEPAPIVLLDAPGGAFWAGLKRFVDDELIPSGVVSPDDLDRVLITDSVDAAVAEVTGFWRNYDSLRWDGETLVLRLRKSPTDAEIDELNERFAPLLAAGRIERSGPRPREVADDDLLELPRLAMVLNQYKVGQLYHLIRAVNDLASAPASIPAGTNNPSA